MIPSHYLTQEEKELLEKAKKHLREAQFLSELQNIETTLDGLLKQALQRYAKEKTTSWMS